jgi:hypothetical protein
VASAAPPSPPPAAPAAAPRKPPAKPPARSGGTGAYLVAVFALLIAVIAAGAAAYAVQLAQEARDGSAAPAATDTATVEPSDILGEAPPPSASVPPSITPSPTAPGGQYAPELSRVELRVPNPNGCTAGYVDVDTANVGVESGHEFYFNRCEDPAVLQVRVDRTSGRSTSGANPSPQSCGSLVAGTPSSELVLAAEEGLTFCLLTNRSQAVSAGLPQRLAIVEVLGISSSEIRIALSTFRVN